MTDAERIKRTEPERDEPIRNMWASHGAGPAGQAGPEIGIDEVIAHAVKLGYRVIGENIEQGREAANRLSQGEYGVKDVPDDLSQLAARLLQLSRQMTVAGFDVMDAILREPSLRSAFGSRSQAPAGPKDSAGVDSRHPAAEPSRARATPGDRAAQDLRLTYQFTGPGRASAAPTVLRQPNEIAMPVHAGLHLPGSGAPPLQEIVFGVAADGLGVVAHINIPEAQPPGVYSGVVCESKSHQALGVMTVTVLT